MELKTKRLILRELKLSDWRDIVEGIGEYDVAKMLLKAPFPYTKKDAVSFINKILKKSKDKNIKDYLFMIELKSENKVIGAIGIHNIDAFSKIATTGSWINKKYWRNGYMSEAKIVVNDFAFNKLKLRKLHSEIFTENIASIKTQEKMGYVFEGTQKKSKKSIATNKIHDCNLYGLFKEDWKNKKKEILKKIK
jgi:ribosomal-protein-alanine N-acetyltransferase